MQQHFHILNGDALLAQFPAKLPGARIVFREALVDGPVDGENLEALFTTRASFFDTHYDYLPEYYEQKTATEIRKIQTLPPGASVYFWFEDDLFCQVNSWLAHHLLHQQNQGYQLYHIRPNSDLRYGFGGMDEKALQAAFEARRPITDAENAQIAQLWIAYQEADFTAMTTIAQNLQLKYPFLLPAVRAHLDRFPGDGSLSRPLKSLSKIMDELPTKAFGPIFQAFCERESIYGFGDLQVKRLLKQLDTP